MRLKLFVTIVLQLFIVFGISAQDIDYKGLPEWSWHNHLTRSGCAQKWRKYQLLCDTKKAAVKLLLQCLA